MVVSFELIIMVVICHANVRSLVALGRIPELEDLVLFKNVHILCVTETWLKPKHLDSTSCAASVAQWLVLSLSERKVVGSNPPTIVHTPCRSPRLAPIYLANAR